MAVKPKLLRAWALPITGGIVPPRFQLGVNDSSANLGSNKNRLSGIPPVSSVPRDQSVIQSNDKVTRADKLPNAGGIVPFNLLQPKLTVLSDVKTASDSGIVPVKDLFANGKVVTPTQVSSWHSERVLLKHPDKSQAPPVRLDEALA